MLCYYIIPDAERSAIEARLARNTDHSYLIGAGDHPCGLQDYSDTSHSEGCRQHRTLAFAGGRDHGWHSRARVAVAPWRVPARARPASLRCAQIAPGRSCIRDWATAGTAAAASTSRTRRHAQRHDARPARHGDARGTASDHPSEATPVYGIDRRRPACLVVTGQVRS